MDIVNQDEVCLPCKAFLEHWNCRHRDDDKCCCGAASVTITAEGEAWHKQDEEVTDPKSTGRKRAVLAKPITPGMPCDWAGLKFAGGAVFPIVGCVNNLATMIHHGPSKCTLDNELSNLHAICATCHNRFHSANDHTYGPDPLNSTWLPEESWGPLIPHDSVTKATHEEWLESEFMWVGGREAREKVQLLQRNQALERLSQEQVS